MIIMAGSTLGGLLVRTPRNLPDLPDLIITCFLGLVAFNLQGCGCSCDPVEMAKCTAEAQMNVDPMALMSGHMAYSLPFG